MASLPYSLNQWDNHGRVGMSEKSLVKKSDISDINAAMDSMSVVLRLADAWQIRVVRWKCASQGVMYVSFQILVTIVLGFGKNRFGLW